MKLFQKGKSHMIKLAVLLAIVLLEINYLPAISQVSSKQFPPSTGFTHPDTSLSSLMAYQNSDKKATVKTYPKRKGEIGVKNTKFPYGNVKRYGAVGDGVTDDHDALVNALNQNVTVYLEENKTYKCNDGIYMNNGQIIKGNHSTILIDNDYAPKSDKIYSFLRYKSQVTGTTYWIYDLTITFNSNYTRENNTAEFVLFNPTGFSAVILNNVTLQTVAGSSRIHMMYACNGVNILNNIKLINNNKAMSGGCLWLHNDTSRTAKILCKNSYFYNSCSDEALAIYGTGEASSTFNNCKFETTNAKLMKNTLPIAIYDSSKTAYSGATMGVDTIFYKCTFNEEFDSKNKYVNVCYLGVGSSNFNKFMTVTLNRCTINDNNPSSPFALRETVDTLAKYNFTNNSMINLYNCNIHSKGAIAGTYNSWANKDSLSTATAPSIHIKDCNIDCVYAIIDIPNTQYYPVIATIEKSTINITKAKAIVKMIYRTPLDFSLKNNSIHADASIPEVLSDKTNTLNTIPIKSTMHIVTFNNTLNDNKMTDFETYIQLN